MLKNEPIIAQKLQQEIRLASVGSQFAICVWAEVCVCVCQSVCNGYTFSDILFAYVITTYV